MQASFSSFTKAVPGSTGKHWDGSLASFLLIPQASLQNEGWFFMPQNSSVIRADTGSTGTVLSLPFFSSHKPAFKTRAGFFMPQNSSVIRADIVGDSLASGGLRCVAKPRRSKRTVPVLRGKTPQKQENRPRASRASVLQAGQYQAA